ncbi:MAG: class I SAM-dependent methyltransferase [Gemmatimonadota bacterium]
MHSNSLWMFQKYAAPLFEPATRVLEIGPNGFPSEYESAMGTDHVAWHTLDLYDSPFLTYRADSMYRYPIPDGSYDIVFSANVLEHVPRIWVWIREVTRVCRPGGLVITINPVSWPFHEYPVDCWRAYPDGMRALYAEAGLEVMLTTWESLEARHFPRHTPGRTPGWWLPGIRKRLYRLLGRIGMRVECAYDTIAIGRKPA